MAVLRKLVLLLLDEHAVRSFQVVYLDVQSMDIALQFGNVCLSGVDSALALVAVRSSNIQLLVERSGAVNQLVPLLLQDRDARALGKALLLPLG